MRRTTFLLTSSAPKPNVFFNPFTKSLASTTSPTFHQLQQLGFDLSEGNPFCLSLAKPARLQGLLSETTSERRGNAIQNSVLAALRQQVETDPSPLPSAAVPPPPTPSSTSPVVSTPRKGKQGVTATTSKKPDTRGGGSSKVTYKKLAVMVERLLDQRLRDYLTRGHLHHAPSVDDTVKEVELTDDQEKVLQMALKGHSMFVGGAAGTGKSVLLRRIAYEMAVERGVRVAVTATTGIASLNLHGQTFYHQFTTRHHHSHHHHGSQKNATSKLAWTDTTPSTPPTTTTSGGGANVGGASRRGGSSGGVTHNTPRPIIFDYSALRAIDVVIIDEISMMDTDTLDAFNTAAQHARLSTSPFGGIQVILSGDFMQLRLSNPKHGAGRGGDERHQLLRNGRWQEIIAPPPPEKLLFHSRLFQTLRHVSLVTPLRQLDDEDFLETLEGLRMGKADGLVDMLADGSQQHGTHGLGAADVSVRLFPTRKAAKLHNMAMMATLTGTEHMYRTNFRRGDLAGSWSDTWTVKASANSRRITLSTLPFVLANRTKGLVPSDLCVIETTAPSDSARSFAVRMKQQKAQGDTMTTTSVDILSTALGKTLGKLHVDKHLQLVKQCKAEAEGFGTKHITAELQRMTSHEYLFSPKTLKQGCRVMLVRNITPTLVNGSMGTIVDFKPFDEALLPKNLREGFQDSIRREFKYRSSISSNEMAKDADVDVNAAGGGGGGSRSSADSFALTEQVLPVVRFDTGEEVQIPSLTIHLPASATTHYYTVKATVMPLTVAYGFTVHKLQGITLNSPMLMDCRKMWECPHLVYVAASRVKRREHLRLRSFDRKHVIACPEAAAFSKQIMSPDELLATERKNKKKKKKGDIPPPSRPTKPKQSGTTSILTLPTTTEKEGGGGDDHGRNRQLPPPIIGSWVGRSPLGVEEQP